MSRTASHHKSPPTASEPRQQHSSQSNSSADASGPQPWHKTLAAPAKEFGPAELQVISGQIPSDIRGAYYQNGTGRLERGGQPVGHWFDGDGAILRVGIAEGKATGTYRYVQTQGYQAEEKADTFLYSNYGRRYPGPLWKHMRGLFDGTSLKNAANTSVLALPDGLLALWEAGHPHRLNPETLETIGIEDFGWLKKSQTFSAHPLQDPISGEIYSIGITPMCELQIYRCSANCQLIQQRKIALKDISLVHSFVIAGPYLVFLISPVITDVFAVLFNRKAFADAANWQGDRGTRVLVIDRESLETVSDTQTDAWFQWHYGNGCVETDGTVRLNFVRFDDFISINEVLREVPSGQVKTKAYGRLWQLRLNPQTGQILSNECVLDRDCEFPQVPAAQIGQPWQHTYLMMHRDGVSTGEDWFGSIGRFDHTTGQLIQGKFSAGEYANEPLHIPDHKNSSSGWVLAVVYNANAERSELWIFDAATLGEPICRLALPNIIPLGFHGTWQST
ncbi:MAG: carotenoid oxygenase family protein [Cyanobacteria bacterium J06632_3]